MYLLSTSNTWEVPFRIRDVNLYIEDIKPKIIQKNVDDQFLMIEENRNFMQKNVKVQFSRQGRPVSEKNRTVIHSTGKNNSFVRYVTESLPVKLPYKDIQGLTLAKNHFRVRSVVKGFHIYLQ